MMHIISKFLLSILLILCVSITYAQKNNDEKYTLTIKKGNIIKENKQIILIVPTTLNNRTKDTLKYLSMSCSWQEFYIVDNKNLQIEGGNCYFNSSTILTLLPGESQTVKIRLLVKRNVENNNILKFRIGFNLRRANNIHFIEKTKKKSIIWSNIITI